MTNFYNYAYNIIYNDDIDYNIRRKNATVKTITVGDGELTNIAEKIVELQEEAKHSKKQKSEYKVMIQFAEMEPVYFYDKKTNEELIFHSNPLGLWVTISKEELLKFEDTDASLLPITIKKEDIETYLNAISYKYGINNHNEGQYHDIKTELNPFDMDNLFTDFTKVNTPPKKKYSKEALFRYARLHGPSAFWKFIKDLPDEVKDLAMAIFSKMFGQRLLDNFMKQENKNRQHKQDDEMELG